jgi:hypothetical protein
MKNKYANILCDWNIGDSIERNFEYWDNSANRIQTKIEVAG